MPETTQQQQGTHTRGTARPVIARNKMGDTFPNYFTVEIGNVRIADCFGEVIGEKTEDGEDKFLPAEEIEANARRLAACWNALKKLSTVGVEKLDPDEVASALLAWALEKKLAEVK